MLVILEGLDNTGKTTIAKMLMQYYKIHRRNKGRRYCYF